jgi:glycosyltransferase involved in cell wall biosynthesis
MDFRNAGIGRVSSEIFKELVKRGHSVRTVTTNGSSLYSYFWYTSVGIALRIPKGMDVYHALTPMEAMWLPGYKSVVTFHDLFQITDKDKLGSGLGYSKWKNLIGTQYFRVAANIASRCAQVVTVSNKTREEVTEYLPVKSTNIKVIRSGISSALGPQRKQDKIYRIGYLGQLDRRKRVDLLITAFRQSQLEELVICGTGPDTDLLLDLAKGDKRIRFFGHLPDIALLDFYNSLDVFVFPTWLEGYGLPIIEAMACKKPVIVLTDAAIPWEVMRRCIIVDKLDYVLGNRTYLETLCKYVEIEDNYRWAKEHSWKTCVDEYVEVYEQVSSV